MIRNLHQASYWEPLNGGDVRCCLCPKSCLISEDNTGFCGVRRNLEGRLYSESYSQVTSIAIDPIEKKPLYHFYPGSQILSIGSYGCNFSCDFCQNWQISQQKPPVQSLPVDRLAELSLKRGSIGVAFTYNEPSIWFEYVRDGARAVQAAGGKVVMVTNGYINPGPLDELLEMVDAFNVDLKSVDKNFYARLCKGSPKPVMETIRKIAAHPKALVEVTCLLVPEERDVMEDLRQIREFIRSVDPDIPVHLSRYFPRYKMDTPATPEPLMRKSYELMRETLPFVYAGNIHIPGTENTYCPGCGRVVVERQGYHTNIRGLKGKRCAHCGHKLPLVV